MIKIKAMSIDGCTACLGTPVTHTIVPQAGQTIVDAKTGELRQVETVQYLKGDLETAYTIKITTSSVLLSTISHRE